MVRSWSAYSISTDDAHQGHKATMWSTELTSVSGHRYKIDIISAVTPSPDEWRLISSQPIELITDSVTPIVDAVQSTRCIVRLYCTAKDNLTKLLMSDTNTVRILISRDNLPVWGGFLDVEGVEVPEPYERGYRAELSFGDFLPLKLSRYTPEGIISIREALAKTVGAYGVPIKTDGAHAVAGLSDQYVDTGLLDDDCSKYDLLELVAKTLCATVRQYGTIRFDSPLRHTQLAAQKIRYTYGEDNFTSIGRVYNTINYKLTSTIDRENKGEVVALVSAQEQLGEDRAKYKEGIIGNADHTFTAVESGVRGFGLSPSDSEGYTYGLLVREHKDYKTWIPKTQQDGEPASIGRKLAEQVSKPLSGGADRVNVSAFAYYALPMLSKSRRQYLATARTSDSIDLFLHIPARITLEYRDASKLYWGKLGWTKDEETTTLMYRHGGFSDTPSNCTTLAASYAALDSPDNGHYKSGPEGLTLPLPGGKLLNARLRVEVYDGIYFTIDRLPITHKDWLLKYTFSLKAGWTHRYKHLCAPLAQYWEIMGNTNGPQPGGLVLQGVSITSETDRDEQELELQAYVSPEVTEEITYDATVSTWDSIPAWTYTLLEKGDYIRVKKIGDKQHWEVVVEALLKLYGSRGEHALLTIAEDPLGQVYSYGDKLFWLTSSRFSVRESRTTLDLQQILDTDWYGEAQV